MLPAPRVIPTLLLKGKGLVKGESFKDHKYVGDPINAVNIFNSKEADELAVLDVTATSEGRTIPLAVVEQLADECLMPFAVGGGISNVDQMRDLLYAGAEKIILNTAAFKDPRLVAKAAERFGVQCIVVSIDVGRDLFKRSRCYTHSGTKKSDLDPVEAAKLFESQGAGEILLTSIEREGRREGFDLDLVRRVSEAVNIPVIASGGAKDFSDLLRPISEAGASAVAAASVFVFHGPKRAVLIQYPTREVLTKLFREVV
jgi:cyclase